MDITSNSTVYPLPFVFPCTHGRQGSCLFATEHGGFYCRWMNGWWMNSWWCRCCRCPRRRRWGISFWCRCSRKSESRVGVKSAAPRLTSAATKSPVVVLNAPTIIRWRFGSATPLPVRCPTSASTPRPCAKVSAKGVAGGRLVASGVWIESPATRPSCETAVWRWSASGGLSGVGIEPRSTCPRTTPAVYGWWCDGWDSVVRVEGPRAKPVNSIGIETCREMKGGVNEILSELYF